MDITTIIIFFIVVGLPTLGLTLVQLAKIIQQSPRKSAKAGGNDGVDDAEIMQQIHLSLSRLEKRIDSLETILFDKRR